MSTGKRFLWFNELKILWEEKREKSHSKTSLCDNSFEWTAMFCKVLCLPSCDHYDAYPKTFLSYRISFALQGVVGLCVIAKFFLRPDVLDELALCCIFNRKSTSLKANYYILLCCALLEHLQCWTRSSSALDLSPLLSAEPKNHEQDPFQKLVNLTVST